MCPGSSAPASTNLQAISGGAAGMPDGISRYLDEDVSFLEVGARVLALAEDDALPLLERVRLLAAAGRRLDEFFQFRGVQLRTLAAGGPPRGRAVRVRAQELIQRQGRLLQRLTPLLSAQGIGLCDWDHLRSADRQVLSGMFHERLLPVLAPLATDPGRALPASASLSLNLVVSGLDPEGRRRFGFIELPPVLPRLVTLPDGRLVPLEQVVMAHLPALFADLEIESCGLYRVTRQGGVSIQANAEDLLASVESQLRLERLGEPVRLEIEARVPEETLDRLLAELDLGPNDVYVVRSMLGMAGLATLSERDRPELKAPRPPAIIQSRLGGGNPEAPPLFSVLDEGDVLVHAPHDSYAHSVATFVAQAARDPAVLAMKQTLYRPNPQSPVVKALVRAAERGTHVVVLVELAARLAEKESVACARALEKAGAHVVYGLVGLRTHCTVSLVVRQLHGEVRRYSLVSTGPHDPTRSPEGMSFLSADPMLAADLADLFNYLTGYSRPEGFRKLVVGPGSLRSRLLTLIRREANAGPDGRVAIKVNRLVDREMIDALYAASQRGTAVDLVVAGACALRPGVVGLSENVRVVAPTSRIPEASRLYTFGTGEDRQWFLSSADLAPRDLDRQVDVAVPVEAPALRWRLEKTIDALLERPAWTLGPDGVWRRSGSGADERLGLLAASQAASPAEASLAR